MDMMLIGLLYQRSIDHVLRGKSCLDFINKNQYWL